MGITSILSDLNDVKFNDFKGIPFWSWNNTLNEDELVKQIEQMKSAGLGGFIMHARTGLKDEYLGDKWFACIEACLKKAKELNMEAWLYDENGWPSGFAGGKLLKKDNYAQYFELQEKDYYDADCYCCFIEAEDGSYKYVENTVEGATKYLCIYIKDAMAFVDVLNPRVVDEFISVTHEEYFKRFKDYFGNTLVGIFTDEPQYFRYKTPYSKTLEAVFEKGEIKQNLIYLFKNRQEGYEFKFKYFKALNDLYTINYYKKIYEWCDAHNCKLTGHAIEETGLFLQMWCCAGVMPSYEYEHIPAIDWLSRSCKTELSPKQVGSVASQLGKNVVLTETFACCGYNATPIELKSVAEMQYFNGVNKICHHLFPYSIAGQAKFDHPPVFSTHNNWFEEFKGFNDYFTRLGYIIGNTQDVYDVGIIHPIRSAYLDYLREEDYLSIKELEDDFSSLISQLRKSGIKFQFIDESILSRHGSIVNGCLQVGNNTYSTIIIPKMKNISSETLTLLEKFQGKLCNLGCLEYVDGKQAIVNIQSNITLDEIKDSVYLAFCPSNSNCQINVRRGEIGEFVFIKNLSSDISCTVELEGIKGEYSRLDLDELEIYKTENSFEVEANGSVILVKERADKDYKTQKEIEATKDFCVSGITENHLVLDKAEWSKDGVSFFDEEYVQGIFDRLLYENYCGQIYIRQKFTVDGKISVLKHFVEKAEYDFYRINGKDITFSQSDFDVNFLCSEISDVVIEGQNIIEYSFKFYQHKGVWESFFDETQVSTETLRTSVYFDTSIESSYIKGRFTVADDLSIKPVEKLPCVGDITNQGYKFFKGDIEYSGGLIYDSKERIAIRLDGSFSVANVTINGVKIDFTMSKEKEITKYLNKGDNKIQITVKSNLRNLFGPHHYLGEGDLESVSPPVFTRRGEWQDGLPSKWSTDYKCLPFGLTDVKILSLN